MSSLRCSRRPLPTSTLEQAAAAVERDVLGAWLRTRVIAQQHAAVRQVAALRDQGEAEVVPEGPEALAQQRHAAVLAERTREAVLDLDAPELVRSEHLPFGVHGHQGPPADDQVPVGTGLDHDSLYAASLSTPI